jgi:hypothetical protein
MICCSRRPTRLIGWSMHCTSRVAMDAARALGSTQDPLRTWDFDSYTYSCTCSCYLLLHPLGQIYGNPLTSCENV